MLFFSFQKEAKISCAAQKKRTKKITNLCILLICTSEYRTKELGTETHATTAELTEAATIMKNQFYLQDHQFCNLALLAMKRHRIVWYWTRLEPHDDVWSKNKIMVN